MKWISTVSQKSSLGEAVRECLSPLSDILGKRGRPDLAFLFVSYHFSQAFSYVPKLVNKDLKPCALVGCSGGGVIGAGQEIEDAPALSLTCAWLPDVQVHPFHVTDPEMPDLDTPPKAWHDLVGVSPKNQPQFVLLADPFSIRVDHFLSALDYAFSRSAKVGGLASGGNRPAENAFFLNEEVFDEGLVGVALSGNVAVDIIVAQGCRPIGKPMTITECQGNLLLTLENRSPLDVLQEIYETLSPHDQTLVHTSLFMGIGMDSSRESLQQGDFLIRNIVGANREKGVLAIGASLRPGQIVQFHLRDAETSADDLHHILTHYTKDSEPQDAVGALLFSCLGRGAYLYGRPNHDTELFQSMVGNIPVSGFFCNGEIGPVGGTSYLHGYTSCFGIFSSRNRQTP